MIDDKLKYQRIFHVPGLRLFIDDIWMDHYKKLDAMVTYLNNEYTSYLPINVIKRTNKTGLKLLKSEIQFRGFVKNFENNMKRVDAAYNTIQPKNILKKAEVENFLKPAARLFYFYSKTEFFYTDLAYKRFTETKNPKLQKNLKAMGVLKEDARKHLNKIFFGQNAYLNVLLRKISSQFNVDLNNLLQYKQKEILGLFEGKLVSRTEIAKRNKAILLVGKKGTLFIETGAKAEAVIKKFIKHRETARSSRKLHGVGVSKGLARGRARVIVSGYDNFDQLRKIISSMRKGDVLVAETTSPELAGACKKAAAIVTNQGGLLSHAAIISRELKIPCVVNTQNATSLIKNGDLVEVDGSRGLVTIIKRKVKR